MSSEIKTSENSAFPVISLEHLSKKYPIYSTPAHKLLEFLSFRRRKMHREFWALRDISLDIYEGDAIGIIGVNGSGKSTLLQIVAGILLQNSGTCRVQGRVAALLELGAGFNPEFTGRENVYMSGAISGFTRQEMEDRFDEILDFAEIGDFIDQPVKTYSSGMFVRLAFAVAIHADPDILIVDEALSVGDLIFQHRCINRIRLLQRQGKTILFVTHDLSALTQFCNRALLLDQGSKVCEGEPEEVANRYRALVFERESREAGAGSGRIAVDEEKGLPLISTIPYVHNRFGEGRAEILGIILHGDSGEVVNEVRSGQEVNILISAGFREDIEFPIVGVTIRDRMGTEITATNTSYENAALPPLKAGTAITVRLLMKVPALRPGSYSISPSVASGNIWEHEIEDWIDNAYIINVVETELVYGMMKWEFEIGYSRIGENKTRG